MRMFVWCVESVCVLFPSYSSASCGLRVLVWCGFRVFVCCFPYRQGLLRKTLGKVQNAQTLFSELSSMAQESGDVSTIIYICMCVQ